jgi:sacsin
LIVVLKYKYLIILFLFCRHVSVTPAALLEVAKAVDRDAAGKTVEPEALVRKGAAALAALEDFVGTPAADSNLLSIASPPPGPEFWRELSSLAFVPVYRNPPADGLPWPHANVPATAPPRLCRLLTDAWIVSASLRLAARNCSEALAGFLGWMEPLPASVLASQLLELGRLHPAVENPAIRERITEACKVIYGELSRWVESDAEQRELVLTALEGASPVWVGDRFVSAKRAAITTPGDFKPYLYSVPEPLAVHQMLLEELGIPAAPAPLQWTAALAAMAEEIGSATPLSSENLQRAVAMADGLAASKGAAVSGDRASRSVVNLELAGLVYLPDEDGKLAPAASLHYNDARWLDHAGLRLVHPDVSEETAAALGAQSLRFHHQVDTQASKNTCTFVSFF